MRWADRRSAHDNCRYGRRPRSDVMRKQPHSESRRRRRWGGRRGSGTALSGRQPHDAGRVLAERRRGFNSGLGWIHAGSTAWAGVLTGVASAEKRALALGRRVDGRCISRIERPWSWASARPGPFAKFSGKGPVRRAGGESCDAEEGGGGDLRARSFWGEL
jgi:hypothetical protein